jgi:hypothetical protein
MKRMVFYEMMTKENSMICMEVLAEETDDFKQVVLMSISQISLSLFSEEMVDQDEEEPEKILSKNEKI